MIYRASAQQKDIWASAQQKDISSAQQKDIQVLQIYAKVQIQLPTKPIMTELGKEESGLDLICTELALDETNWTAEQTYIKQNIYVYWTDT